MFKLTNFSLFKKNERASMWLIVVRIYLFILVRGLKFSPLLAMQCNVFFFLKLSLSLFKNSEWIENKWRAKIGSWILLEKGDLEKDFFWHHMYWKIWTFSTLSLVSFHTLSLFYDYYYYFFSILLFPTIFFQPLMKNEEGYLEHTPCLGVILFSCSFFGHHLKSYFNHFEKHS